MDHWLASKLLALGHLMFASYMFLGWAAIVGGSLAGAPFVRAFWFRLTHLAGFAAVLAVSLCFRACPLTVLEYELLAKAGRIAGDLSDAIVQNPREMAAFLRVAKDLPAEEIDELAKEAQKRRAALAKKSIK